jgi:hypothetical protein
MSHPISFSERVLQLIAEDKIQAAIKAGEFDDLPGFGQPLPLLDEPYDELWWVRRKIILEELGGMMPSGVEQVSNLPESQ